MNAEHNTKKIEMRQIIIGCIFSCIDQVDFHYEWQPNFCCKSLAEAKRLMTGQMSTSKT